MQDVQYYNAKKVVIDSSLQTLCVYLYVYVSVCIYTPVSIYLYPYTCVCTNGQDVQYYNAKKVVIDSSLQAMCVCICISKSLCVSVYLSLYTCICTNVQDVQYYNAKKVVIDSSLQTLAHQEQPRVKGTIDYLATSTRWPFGNNNLNLNTNISTVHVPTNIYDKCELVLLFCRFLSVSTESESMVAGLGD